MVPNNISFSLRSDATRNLIVGLQSVSIQYANGSSKPLLSNSNSIYTMIDSTDPHIFLPTEACQAFEDTFGLVWNTTYKTYLVDDNLHQTLMEANQNITFRLSNLIQDVQHVDISLPYSSFDLKLNYPLVPPNLSGTRYFPIMRTSNDSQYTLGRTFLQEA